MLRVTNLRKVFSTQSARVLAVDDASFEIPDGAFVSIVGRSGSGKSTLLNLLGGLEKPTSGAIELDGKDIARMSERQLVHYRATSIGFVFQSYNLIPNLSALENVIIAMEAAGMKPALRRRRAAELLSQVGLNDAEMRRKPSRLSGGQQQRVAIARALANHPTIVFADEPTGNLDEHTGQMIIKLLRELAITLNITFVIVTHDTSVAARADKVITLKDGKVQ